MIEMCSGCSWGVGRSEQSVCRDRGDLREFSPKLLNPFPQALLMSPNCLWLLGCSISSCDPGDNYPLGSCWRQTGQQPEDCLQHPLIFSQNQSPYSGLSWWPYKGDICLEGTYSFKHSHNNLSPPPSLLPSIQPTNHKVSLRHLTCKPWTKICSTWVWFHQRIMNGLRSVKIYSKKIMCEKSFYSLSTTSVKGSVCWLGASSPYHPWRLLIKQSRLKAIATCATFLYWNFTGWFSKV